MRNMIFLVSVLIVAVSAMASDKGEFDAIFNKVVSADGVKKITYDQFMKVRNSGEKFVLVDVMSAGDYRTGHIAAAISIPIGTVSEKVVKNKIPAGSRVIVYCNGFDCHASSQAAKKISGYGYKVLDYKGGLQDWQARGGKLVK